MELQHADVIVIGAGTVGSMALWQLSKREGLTVVGIEQYGRVHPHGSYAGESRVFRTAVHEGGTYVGMIQRSRELWRELERESGRDIYAEVGCLSIAPEGFPDLETAIGTVRQFDIPHRLLSTEDLRAQYPQHRIADGDVALLDEHGGGLRPEVAVMSALDLAEANGAELHFNTPVLELEERGNGVVVRTTQGAWLARTVVVASGSWSTRLSPELNDLLRLQVLGLTWFMPRHPEQFVPERFPAFLRDAGPIHFRRRLRHRPAQRGGRRQHARRRRAHGDERWYAPVQHARAHLADRRIGGRVSQDPPVRRLRVPGIRFGDGGERGLASRLRRERHHRRRGDLL